jgi:3'-phosphoadenosine 5'-phosphosulfate sulfotransferase (PAPS reductase)/FAD synthetase
MIDALLTWCGSGAMPSPAPPYVRAAMGEHYPAKIIAAHARSGRYLAAVSNARRALDEAAQAPVEWRVGASAGKDSTALALLAAEDGFRPGLLSVKDDLDYPGEDRYIAQLAAHTGQAAEVLRPAVSLRGWLARHRVGLLDDLHGRAAALSSEHFYGLLDRHRAAHGYTGVLLGLRAEESKARAGNASRGAVYTRRDGLTVGQPLASWTALDVHACLWSFDVPPLPVYLCIDDPRQALDIRKSWWVAGGEPALRFGHYAWLRRWWPDLWRLACEIDPAVRAVS